MYLFFNNNCNCILSFNNKCNSILFLVTSNSIHESNFFFSCENTSITYSVCYIQNLNQKPSILVLISYIFL